METCDNAYSTQSLHSSVFDAGAQETAVRSQCALSLLSVPPAGAATGGLESYITLAAISVVIMASVVALAVHLLRSKRVKVGAVSASKSAGTVSEKAKARSHSAYSCGSASLSTESKSSNHNDTDTSRSPMQFSSQPDGSNDSIGRLAMNVSCRVCWTPASPQAAIGAAAVTGPTRALNCHVSTCSLTVDATGDIEAVQHPALKPALAVRSTQDQLSTHSMCLLPGIGDQSDESAHSADTGDELLSHGLILERIPASSLADMDLHGQYRRGNTAAKPCAYDKSGTLSTPHLLAEIWRRLTSRQGTADERAYEDDAMPIDTSGKTPQLGNMSGQRQV